ncbi:MAG: hypothetical protein Q9164_006782 [Protoblastenia rupestris]
MDPLSVTSSLVSALSIANSVVHSLSEWARKNQSPKYDELRKEAESLLETLKHLNALLASHETAESRQDWSVIKRLLQSPEDVLGRIVQDIQEASLLVLETSRTTVSRHRRFRLLSFRRLDRDLDNARITDLRIRLAKAESLLRSYMNLAATPLSLVIDDLFREHLNDKTPVTYFYCDYREQDTYSAAHILSSLLKQLLTKLYPLPQSFMNVFDGYQHGKDTLARPRLQDVKNEFISTASRFRQIFVVLDALDECNAAYRTEILHMITWLGHSFRVFITSRHEPDIDKHLEGYRQIILPTAGLKTDIEAYISASILRTQLALTLDASFRTSDEREHAKTYLIKELWHKSQGS